MAPPCTFCNQSPPISAGSEQASFQRCAACHVVCYCSRDCQKSDWKYHKLVCKYYSEFIEKIPRPSELHKLTLVLHPKMETPKFFWIACEHVNAGSESWEEPDVARYFETPTEPGDAWIKRYHVSKMLRLKFPDDAKYALDHTVGIYRNKAWALDGSQPNMCIDKMMKGEAPLKWAGLMIAFTYQGLKIFQRLFRISIRLIFEL